MSKHHSPTPESAAKAAAEREAIASRVLGTDSPGTPEAPKGLTVSDREREAFQRLSDALGILARREDSARKALVNMRTAESVVTREAAEVWSARGNILPVFGKPEGRWNDTEGRPSFRALAVALIPNPRGWVGHAGANVSAARLATMDKAEAAYWRRVATVAKALERAAKAAGYKPKGRTSAATVTTTKGAAGAPASPVKGVSATPEAPATPSKPDADALRVAVEQLAAGGTAGLSKRDADKVRKAITAAAPASPVAKPEPVKPEDIAPETLRKALGAMTAARYVDPALLAVCEAYLTMATLATVAAEQSGRVA